MIQVISYSSSDYYENLQNRFVTDCVKFGLINHQEYTQRWLHNTQFYQDNKNLLDEQRGAGFWVWKPFIIRESMSYLAPGDIVCYCDASTTLRVDPTAVINSVKDVLVCDSSWLMSDWTKNDCFHYMHCDGDLYRNSTQVWAGSVIVRNTEVGNDLISDWLKYSCDRRIISDDKSVSGPDICKDHRHDQAILSNLIRKYTHEYEMTGVRAVPTMPFIDE